MNKILIAEDDKFLSNAYRVKLVKEGFDIKIAADGREVLQFLTEFSPDVIILDLVMPGMDGFAVLQEMKKNDVYKNIPVIVASNLGQKEDLERAKALGAVDYVIKNDLSMSELIAKIRAILPQSSV